MILPVMGRAEAAPKGVFMKISGIGLKLISIAAIVGALLIGLLSVSGLLKQRRYASDEAVGQIQESAGNSFYIAGPYIAVPVRRVVNGETRTSSVILKASAVNVKASIRTEKRTVGIYTAPVFTGTLAVDARFDIRLPESGSYEYLPGSASVYVVVKNSSLSGRPVFSLNGKEYGTGDIEVPDESSDTLNYVGTAAAVRNGRLEFKASIPIRGAGSFSIGPSGETTKLAVTCDWPSPGFTDFKYLPVERSLKADGFSADWSVPFPEESKNGAIGFSYIQPVNLYKQLERAITYGFLFIIVPFIVFFLFEVFAKIQLHPVHYLLSGAGCVIFFLLLLSFSEHIPFGASYLASAAAVSFLVSWYVGTVSGRKAVGFGMLPVFGVLYGFLFLSLGSEDNALLIGALFAFTILAALMICTRKVDWAGLGGK